MAAIRGAAEILREGPPPDVAARFTDNILQQNARMQSPRWKNYYIRQSWKIALEIAFMPVDVDTLFRQLQEQRSVALAAKGLTFHCEPGNVQVAGDSELLAQALGNLLDNAIDFTPAGGVVTLRASNEGGAWALSVSDSGSGDPGVCAGARV